MGRFVKTAQITRVPQRLAVIAIDRIECDNQHVMSRWHCLYSRRRSDNWAGKIQAFSGDNPAELWQQLRTLCGGMGRVYTVIEDGIEGLTLCGFWDEVDAGRMSIRPIGTGVSNIISTGSVTKKQFLPLVMSDKVDIVGCNHADGTLRMVAPKNHGFDHTRKARHEYLDRTEWHRFNRWADDRWPTVAIADRALCMLRYYQILMRWWMIGSCGSWQDSLGSLGMAWWKRLVPKRSVLIHNCARAHDHETSACFGGRQQVFFHGMTGTQTAWQELRGRHPECSWTQRIETPVYELDFRALYPTIMQHERFPVHLIDEATTLDINELMAGTDIVDGLYRCRVKPQTAWLPYRRERGVCYPTGEWVQTLTTPEFRHAVRSGEVLEVLSAYLYRTGYPLKAFAEKALGMRWITERVKSRIGARLFKAVANALSGKMAAHQNKWVDCDNVRTTLKWGSFPVSEEKPEDSFQCRVIAGRTQRLVRSENRVPGLTAIYAHLTAYARLLAHQVIVAAGDGGCIYWDTDGGIFTPDGVERVTAALPAITGGKYQMKPPVKYECTIHRAPKRHFRDGEYVISGIPNGFRVDGKGVVHWHRDLCSVRGGVDPNIAGVHSVSSSTTFDSIASGVPVSSTGWSIPLVVSVGELFTASPSPSSSPMTLFDSASAC